MSEATVTTIVNALESSGGHSIVVLSGVAGTGKTFHAARAAEKFVGSPLLVKQIQFHSAYSYEDLIEGLRPNPSGGFELVSGALLDWNTQALTDPGNRYVLLIEEFTRANVSAVLGEVFTYIEYRDRYFQLPLSKRKVRIADNLMLLATMNPQDKSALELDDALIRRLCIVVIPPSCEELEEVLTKGLVGLPSAEDTEIRNGLKNLFEACKREFGDGFDDLMPFGHGIFATVRRKDDLIKLWQQRIRFLLQRTPHVPPHPFADVIKANYPWKS